MLNSEGKPLNYFGDEAPGDSLPENVENEKLKLLRLIAEHGTTGQRIYDDAAKRTRQTAKSSKSKATEGEVNVPIATIQEVSNEYERSTRVFDEILEESAAAAKEDQVRRQSIEAIYKDNLAGDPTMGIAAQSEIDAYLADAAARKAGRGGGGGGGRRGGGPPSSSPTTIPAGMLDMVADGVDSVSAALNNLWKQPDYNPQNYGPGSNNMSTELPPQPIFNPRTDMNLFAHPDRVKDPAERSSAMDKGKGNPGGGGGSSSW